MIVVGAILLVLGVLLGFHILVTLGLVLLVVGAVLALLGALGHPLWGRSHFF